ncbi:MAG: ABC transporter permease [Planctomycetota bacterium]
MANSTVGSSTTGDAGALELERTGDDLVVRLSGVWRLALPRGSIDALQREIVERPPRRVAFDARAIRAWDSGLVALVRRVRALAAERSIAIDVSGLPDGVQRLLHLAEAVPEALGVAPKTASPAPLARIGTAVLGARARLLDVLEFLGETTLGLARFARRAARLRIADLWLFVQEAGIDALPIVTLISFLVGTIMAFVGAVQLERFGASIFIADLVGLAMTREMGAMMTAIIVCGRTGASYAAQLGTMKVTEEVDALSTFGIPPIEFLVVPRIVALVVMMPCLCLYADLIGILGGAVVAAGMLDLSSAQYFEQMSQAVTLTQVWIGVSKSAIFGLLIALAGCYQGIRCGGSAAAVGRATTSAVVVGIVAIVATDGILAVVCNVLGI